MENKEERSGRKTRMTIMAGRRNGSACWEVTCRGEVGEDGTRLGPRLKTVKGFEHPVQGSGL